MLPDNNTLGKVGHLNRHKKAALLIFVALVIGNVLPRVVIWSRTVGVGGITGNGIRLIAACHEVGTRKGSAVDAKCELQNRSTEEVEQFHVERTDDKSRVENRL
jgi:hypothetical protein